ncbi:MAG: glyceraldehyde 3-phosphate dehydrogenase NAD-binding domain-containing protein [Lentisphaerota bacterium]
MTTAIRVGINGFGRIGRAIFRRNLAAQVFDVVVINDINPDIANVAYQLNYDTTYGALHPLFTVTGNRMTNGTHEMAYYTQREINQVPWSDHGVDVVIDASGVQKNVLFARSLLEKQPVRYALITHSPEEVDFTLVLGANEEDFDPDRHRLISSSICDATALAPCMKLVDDAFGIVNGYITTLHPWLSYQNLMDGPASSWSRPGEIYHHYALGRAMVGNMIPKPTTAVEATCKVLKNVAKENIGSFSYRTPLPIVASADLTLNLRRRVTTKNVVDLFTSAAQKQRWSIFNNNTEPLVSNDFKQSEFSAVVDHRWTDVINETVLKIVLWYDNEWGYSCRVVDQVAYVTAKKGKG